MQHHRRPNAATIIIAGLVLVLALCGTATAAKLITSKDIKNGTIKTVDLSKSAKKALRGPRGKQGPVGPQGALGPQGPQGAQGPAGPSTLSGITAWDASVVVTAGGSDGGTVMCDPGQRVISGGWWFTEDSAPNANMLSDVANDDRTGWIVWVDNTLGSTAVELNGEALCVGAGQAVAGRTTHTRKLAPLSRADLRKIGR
jgi:hypothetical protein